MRFFAMARALRAVAWVLAPLITATPALAQNAVGAAASTEKDGIAGTENAEPPSPHRMVWHYARFRWWEYVAAGAVSVGNLSLELLYQQKPGNRWSKAILVDAPVRNWLRAETEEGRVRADHISDYLWHGSTVYVIVDGVLTPLASDDLNTDVAFQLTLLNWQAIGLAGLLARLSHVSVGRARPSLQGCSDDPNSDNPCEFRGASFVAGHPMMTSANAGLACASHHALPLYGGGAADAVVCPVMVTTALSVGVLRIVADKHWVSDTVVGWVAGGAIGFGLPWLLHYSHDTVRRVASPIPDTAIIPWVGDHFGGVQFIGRL